MSKTLENVIKMLFFTIYSVFQVDKASINRTVVLRCVTCVMRAATVMDSLYSSAKASLLF